MAKGSRKSPNKFLKGKLIQNERYRRIDYVGLEEDAEVLNIDHSEAEGSEPIHNAQEYLKAKQK